MSFTTLNMLETHGHTRRKAPANVPEAKRVNDPTLLNFIQSGKQQVEEVKRQVT
jgi:hypothetical protein